MGRGEQGVPALARVAQLARATPVSRERLPRRAASVGGARLLVDDVLVAHGVTDRSVLDTAVLLASELATDGVQHGDGPDLLVEIALGPDLVQLTVTVTSAEEASQPGQHSQHGPPVAEHSQQVLDIMAAAWEVRVGAGARTGWCRIDRLTIEAPPPPEDPEPDPVPPRSRTRSAASRVSTSRPALRRVK